MWMRLVVVFVVVVDDVGVDSSYQKPFRPGFPVAPLSVLIQNLTWSIPVVTGRLELNFKEHLSVSSKKHGPEGSAKQSGQHQRKDTEALFRFNLCRNTLMDASDGYRSLNDAEGSALVAAHASTTASASSTAPAPPSALKRTKTSTHKKTKHKRLLFYIHTYVGYKLRNVCVTYLSCKRERAKLRTELNLKQPHPTLLVFANHEGELGFALNETKEASDPPVPKDPRDAGTERYVSTCLRHVHTSFQGFEGTTPN